MKIISFITEYQDQLLIIFWLITLLGGIMIGKEL